MKVLVRKTIDIATGRVLEELWQEYDGPIALCKGDKNAQSSEQMQLQLNQQLMGMFQKQFASQTQITNAISSAMTPLLTNPQGMSPEALAAARTSASETVASNYTNAQKTLQNQIAARGGSELPSGVDAQLQAQLQAARASDESSAQNNITLQNEQMKLSNFFNAASILNGTAAQINPLGYAGAATSGTNAVANVSQAITASQQSGWLNALIGGVTGAGSSFLKGGFSSISSKSGASNIYANN